MQSIKKAPPLYLFLLLVFYLLHHYNELFGFISLTQIFFYLAICLFTIILFLLLSLICKSSPTAAFSTFCVLAFFLFFGPVHDLLKSIFGKSFFSSYKFVVPVSFFLIVLSTLYLNSRSASLTKLSRYLNMLFVIFCALELIMVVVNTFRVLKTNNLIYPDMRLCNTYSSVDLPDSSKPDIYYLVFDEYTNNSTLQKLWGFDNSPITNWLSNNGFYVISESNSNYNATPFSLGSTFNMNYLDKEIGDKGSSINDLRANKSLSINETFCILNKENYAIRFIAPFNNSIENNGLSHYFDYLSEEQLYASTFLGRFARDILWNFKKKKPARFENFSNSYTGKAEDINRTIAEIKSTTDTSIHRNAKIVYGHLMITHEPHLFDSTGNLRSSEDFTTNNQPFSTYTTQVLYANKVIQGLVSHIQATNKKNTVIIIQGDHGYRSLPTSMRNYYFPIFNAVYFPDKNYAKLYKEMSPVNTFRIFFNQYFNQKYELLKDSSTVVKQL